ncbi:MAG: hypothetical protein OXH68_20655 [Gammaproteobacteria bacterium]|nr:hypothetical protein [Gammaproteobacteria bacterium]
MDGASLSGVAVSANASSSESATTLHSRIPNGFRRVALAASSYSGDLSVRHARNACGLVSHSTTTFLNGQSRLPSSSLLIFARPGSARVAKSSTAFSGRNGSLAGVANQSGRPTTSVP